jgi:hypothetical protein
MDAPRRLLPQRSERSPRVNYAAPDHCEQRVHALELFVADFEIRLVQHDEIRELAGLNRAHVVLFEVEPGVRHGVRAYNPRVLDINALPDDVEELKRLVIEHHSAAQAKDLQLREQSREIEHLRFELAKLRRARFGQSTEVLDDVGQLPLTFEELKAAVAGAQRQVQAVPEIDVPPAPPIKPVRRKQLPEHFERIHQVIKPQECACPDCGGPLGNLGIYSSGPTPVGSARQSSIVLSRVAD